MKTLGQLHVFGVAKLVMVVLFDSKKFKKTIKLNESGQKEPSLMICHKGLISSFSTNERIIKRPESEERLPP